MKTSSIQFKFMSAILLTTSIALIVSSAAVIIYDLQIYKERVSDEVTTQAILLGRALTPSLQFNDTDSAQNYLSILKSQPAIEAAAIYNERGVLFSHFNLSEENRQNFTEFSKNDTVHYDNKALSIYKPIVVNEELIGFVYVKMRYQYLEELLGKVAISGGVIVLAMLVALIVSFSLQKTITRPLNTLSALSRLLVKTRDYSLRAERVEGGGEVGVLIDAYNEMLDEIEQRNKLLEHANAELEVEIQERREAEQALKDSEATIKSLNEKLEKRVRERTFQLEIANKELEAFSYSVSHDLRTPLRALDGFSQALLEDYQNAFDDEGRDYLDRIRQAAQNMGQLIDDMLKLSRVTRADINFQDVDLSELVHKIVEGFKASEPTRKLELNVTSGLIAHCDPHLIKIALANLIGNAWKYSAGSAITRIEFGMRQPKGNDIPAYFIQDNGVGFDMKYADKLFGAFQRMHSAVEFEGSGIGLATVKRVISKHNGNVWAESSPGKGAVFYFTLPIVENENAELNSEEETNE